MLIFLTLLKEYGVKDGVQQLFSHYLINGRILTLLLVFFFILGHIIGGFKGLWGVRGWIETKISKIQLNSSLVMTRKKKSFHLCALCLFLDLWRDFSSVYLIFFEGFEPFNLWISNSVAIQIFLSQISAIRQYSKD